MADILDWLQELAVLVEQIKRHSPNFAAQLERAGQSVLLNTAEGMDARGRNKSARYNIALCEMRESYAVLEGSVRLRYIACSEPGFEDRCQKILGTLVRLSRPKPAR